MTNFFGVLIFAFNSLIEAFLHFIHIFYGSRKSLYFSDIAKI